MSEVPAPAILATSEPIFVDEKIAAAKTGLSVSYLQRARVERIGPKYHRVGRRCLYKLVELVEWIESGKAATETLSTPTSRKVSK